MPVLTEPLEPRRARALRAAVLGHLCERDATVLSVGEPVGVRARHAVRRGERLDAALRAELVAALVLRLPVVATAPDCLVWLARPGSLEAQDVDADWLAAAMTACGEAALDLTFVVVGREGWMDPRSGAGVRWKRLRDRSRRWTG